MQDLSTFSIDSLILMEIEEEIKGIHNELIYLEERDDNDRSYYEELQVLLSMFKDIKRHFKNV